ncbi:M10 family metallopeptidase C-terminal domain-containing protein [Roseomonas sp. GC11]|nr:M10 family metallopeptidase C-terminal domain-containing protein [Roseomonas sp. GC11]
MAEGVRIAGHYAGHGLGTVQLRLTLHEASSGSDLPFTSARFASGLAGTDQGDGLEVILGTSGDDTITGGGGFYDHIDAGAGHDTVAVGAGTTYSLVIGGAGNDSLTGGDGNDTFRPGRGDDTIDGGAGWDMVDYSDASAAVTVDLALSTAQAVNGRDGADTLAHIEAVAGSRGNDTLSGDAAANTLMGGDGADTLDGRAGADRLEGGTGSDLYYVDDAGDVVVEVAGPRGGADRVISSVSYTLGDGVERLSLAGSADLTATGNAQGNRLDGNDGANTLSGLAGNDVLYGGAGNDTLLGGAGEDFLFGQGGADLLTGGAGRDSFVWSALDDSSATSLDSVTDFTQGTDRLVLAPIDARGATAANDAFGFIGSAAFSAAGQVRAEATEGGTLLQLNTDADTATVEMEIFLAGFTGTLTARDFLL